MNKLTTNTFASTDRVQTPSKKRIRWWLIFSIFAIPFFVIGSVIFVFRVGWTIREFEGRNAMASELQKLIVDGFATSNERISIEYFERTSNQATLDWTKVFEECHSLPFAASTSGVPTLDRKVEIDDFLDDFETSSDWAFAEVCIRFAREQKNLIDQVRHLSFAPTPTYFPIDFQSFETLLPEVQSLRTVACMLRIDAQVAMHQNDTERAFQDILTLFALSKPADAVPFTVSRLVGISIRRMALRALQKAIEQDLLTEPQLLELDRIVENHCDIGDRWRVTMSDEMASSLPVFANPNMSMRTNKRIPARGHDAVYFIGIMRRAIEIPTDDWQILYNSSGELESEILKDSKSITKQVDLILTGILAPAFQSLATALINESQLHRQARIAIAIRMYSREHNKPPIDLSQLPEQVRTLKQFGNLPFGYTVVNQKAVLWGFELSKEVQQTPLVQPDVDSPNAQSLLNLERIWRFYL